MIVTEPCVVRGMPEDVYHADPVEETSLSYSGSKAILKSPARFQYDREHPKQTSALDFGTAAHNTLLGRGPEIVPVRRVNKDGTSTLADDWRSPSTQQHRDELRAVGKVGLLRKQLDVVEAMVAELWKHPYTPMLFGDGGEQELSLFWRDVETRIMLRCRLDRLTRLRSGRPVIVDYKTTAGEASPEDFCWDARKWRYYMQDPHYREGADTLIEPGHAYLMLVQEKEPPYQCAYHELDADSRERGAFQNGVARRLYAECMTTGEWPSYPPIVHTLHVPNGR